MKSDVQLQRDIEAELDWEPSIDAREMRVSVEDGTVVLTGSAPTYPDKTGAETAVKRVSGVRAVRNDINVNLRKADIVSDEQLLQNAQAILAAQFPLWFDRIKATVTDRCLTLEGDLEWHFQKEAVEAALARVSGVEDVVNKIRIEPRAAPIRVQEKIEVSLHRAANLDARAVIVKAKGGAVTLEGETRSWGERTEVERATWSAPGVWSVDNRIVVSSQADQAA